MAIFSTKSIRECVFFNDAPNAARRYSQAEMSVVEQTLSSLFQNAAHGKKPVSRPSSVQQFTLAVGVPGSGKTTFLEEMLENDTRAKRHGLLFDFDNIRDELPLYTDTLNLLVRGGMSEYEADQHAYRFSRCASLYIYRNMVNRAEREGYDILSPLQPVAAGYDEYPEKIARSGMKLHTHILLGDQDVIAESIDTRARLTGRFANADNVRKQFDALPYSIERICQLSAKTEIHIREAADSGASLAANMQPTGILIIYNGKRERLKALIGPVPDRQGITAGSSNDPVHSRPMAAL